MKAADLPAGIRAIRVVRSLPPDRVGEVIGRQLFRSATSVGANYRAIWRAKSTADMLAKLKIVEEEADETRYWLEMIVAANRLSEEKPSPPMNETSEVVAMIVSSIKTLRFSPKS